MERKKITVFPRTCLISAVRLWQKPEIVKQMRMSPVRVSWNSRRRLIRIMEPVVQTDMGVIHPEREPAAEQEPEEIPAAEREPEEIPVAEQEPEEIPAVMLAQNRKRDKSVSGSM